MAIKFLHTPKNKQFNFKPRYYNQEKELEYWKTKDIKEVKEIAYNQTK